MHIHIYIYVHTFTHMCICVCLSLSGAAGRAPPRANPVQVKTNNAQNKSFPQKSTR